MDLILKSPVKNAIEEEISTLVITLEVLTKDAFFKRTHLQSIFERFLRSENLTRSKTHSKLCMLLSCYFVYCTVFVGATFVLLLCILYRTRVIRKWFF